MTVSTTLGRPALALLGLGLVGLAGCQPDIDNQPTPSAGNANFRRYIAVGNSLTAGYADDGLYREGQLNSYPLIVSQQMSQVGGGQFRQPLFTEAQASGSGYLRLVNILPTGPVTQRVPGTAGRATPTAAPYTKYLDPIENLGVPGIRMADIHTANFGSLAPLRAYDGSNFNPYFERITADGNAQSYFQRVRAETGYPAYTNSAGTTAAVTSANGNATFFSMWLGNNDVLGYATSGGAAQNAANTNLGTPPLNTLTRTDSFNLKALRMVNLLAANGARGVVSNIPDVTGIPFFTTVGPALKARLTAASVPGLVIFTGGNPGAATTGNRKQIATADIRDASGAGRQLFTLTASAYIGQIGQITGLPWRQLLAQAGQPRAALGPYLTAYAIDTTQAFGASVGNPLPSAIVLDDAEQTLVTTALTAYNASLLAAANARGLAFFDANAYFRQVATTGVATNGVNNTTNFISGNLFSLDGVHPTPRGYALVANEIIRAINARYGATVQQVSGNEYRGILLP